MTPSQRRNRKIAGGMTTVIGIVVILTGMLSNPLNLDLMIWGAATTGAGQLISAFAE
jgi:hypothetical protein